MQLINLKKNRLTVQELSDFSAILLVASAPDLAKHYARVFRNRLPESVLSSIDIYLNHTAHKFKELTIFGFNLSPELRVDFVALPTSKNAASHSVFEFHQLARQCSNVMRKSKAEKIVTLLEGDLSCSSLRLWIRSLVGAIGAGQAVLPCYKSEPKKKFSVKKIAFLGTSVDEFNAAHEAKSELPAINANNLVRFLSMLPPNELNCKSYVDLSIKKGKELGLTCKFFSFLELQKMGAGAFIAVAQAQPESGAGIVRLQYKVSSRAKSTQPKHLAIVGKGVVFDTGGLNIKPAAYMRHMKGDMAGSALALALIAMAAEERWPFSVTAFLCISNNVVSNQAYCPDSVVTSLSGKTIEIMHTDAEGRMLLADGLTLASRDKPDVIFDIATLTGAAVGAISNRYSAVFTNRENWHETIRQAGRDSGERVWTFPLDDDLGNVLKSEIADFKQCLVTGGADHIEAAFFLKQFVGKGIDWMHLDLSAERCEGGLGLIPTEYTGFGVRFIRAMVAKVFNF